MSIMPSRRATTADRSTAITRSEAYHLVAVRSGLELDGWTAFLHDCGDRPAYPVTQVWAWLNDGTVAA